MRTIFKSSIGSAAVVLAAWVLAWAVGGSIAAQAAATSPTGKTPAKKTSTTPPAQASVTVPPLPTNTFVSVFSTDNPRDPFHPNIKSKRASQPVLTGVPGDLDQSQLVTVVQNGFQGIYGTGDERLLMVHGMLMPENRETTIVVSVNGQQRKLKVKALKIYRNTAQVQVEGLPQPITVPKAR
jgi:hypothetical protein